MCLMFANNVCAIMKYLSGKWFTWQPLVFLMSSKGVPINFEATKLWFMSTTSWMLNDNAIMNFGRILTFDHEKIECLFIITDLINMSLIPLWGDVEDNPNLCGFGLLFEGLHVVFERQMAINFKEDETSFTHKYPSIFYEDNITTMNFLKFSTI